MSTTPPLRRSARLACNTIPSKRDHTKSAPATSQRATRVRPLASSTIKRSSTKRSIHATERSSTDHSSTSQSARHESHVVSMAVTYDQAELDIVERVTQQLAKDTNFKRTFKFIAPKLVGLGASNVVFAVQCLTTKQTLALKVEFTPNMVCLKRECSIMNKLRDILLQQNGTTINTAQPRVITEYTWHIFGALRAVSTKLYQTNLHYWRCRLPVSYDGWYADWRHAAVEAVQAVRDLHRCSVLHNDIKPANLVWEHGSDVQKTRVILLDYGEARKVHPQQDNDTLQRGKNGTPALVNELVGTTTFASINSHHGLPLSYKDDLQSLAYCLWWLAYGQLPWKEGDALHDIVDRKLAYKEKGEHACPRPVVHMLDISHGLEFRQQPVWSEIIAWFDT